MTNKKTTATPTVPVVAIGASAGGLEAFERFLELLPQSTGAAYVLVQHLASDAPSQLTDILSKHTKLPVKTVSRRQRLRPDTVYVLKPGTCLVTEGDFVRPVRQELAERPPLPVDRLFRAVAESHGSRAVGLIFSGFGADGSLGVKAIKERGGLTMVQSPDNARYPSMPRSALQTQQVDRTLPLDELVPTLAEYLRHIDRLPETDEDSLTLSDNDWHELFALLERHRHRDFRPYKRQMVNRRVQRRMALAGLEDFDSYRALLDSCPEELDRLSRDLLVSVTRFFRDPDAFAALQHDALAEILRSKGPEDPVRVWVPACATGEEVYSIGILLLELMDAESVHRPLQLFATDVDEAALQIARTGLYPATISADVSRERLSRFFEPVDEEYRVGRRLREAIVFARHDILSDPPYSRLDLVSCRNFLIYLEHSAQRRLLSVFHFALREGGYLFLGNAESIGQKTDLFAPTARRHGLFQPLAAPLRHRDHLLSLAPKPTSTRVPAPKYGRAETAAEAFGSGDIDRSARQLILSDYVPATALVSRTGELLYTYGDTRAFLGLPTGRQRLDLVGMAVPDLRPTLSTALHKAQRQEGEVALIGTTNRAQGESQAVRITVRELARPTELRGLLLVTFEPVGNCSGAQSTESVEAEREQRLSDELRITREELQDKIDSLEAANEDLKGSNEEILSMNEELQSTNEALETAQEEMQSLNEELTTVNSELQNKVEDLESTNDDLVNLVDSTQLATLFLDRHLRIKRYTPPIKRLIALISSDIGRPLQDIQRQFEDPQLSDDAQRVLSDLQARQREVRAQDDRWYLRRCVPYRTSGDKIDGVVVTLTDITDLKKAQLNTQAAERRWRLLADSVPVMIAYVGRDGNLVFGNAAIRHTLGMDSKSLKRRAFASLVQGQHGARLANEIEKARYGQVVSFDARLNRSGNEHASVAVSLVPEKEVPNGICGFYAVLVNITERQQQTELLKQAEEFAKTNRLASMNEITTTLAHQLNQPLGAITNYAATLTELLPADSLRIKEIVGHIRNQADAAADIVRHIRDFVSRETADWQTIDPNLLVREALARIEARVRHIGATVDTELAQSLPNVYGSTVLLEQVLINVFGNALDAMAQSALRYLTISTATSGDGSNIEIGIHDTGPGVTPEQSAQLFEPFYSTKPQGLGMGLAICATILEEHGGRIWATSGSDGTTFWLRLPASGIVSRVSQSTPATPSVSR